MRELLDRARSAQRLPEPSNARALRKAAGLSAVEVATELKVHRVTLVRWENGSRRPRGAQLVAYVKLLDKLREVTADAG